MRHTRGLGIVLIGVAVLVQGCEKAPPPPDYKPREAPEFGDATGTRPAGAAATRPMGDPHAGLPGFEPRKASPPSDEVTLELNPPAEWTKKPPRVMTSEVYVVPRAEGDPEDADLAVSYLTAQVQLQMNVDRWCSQFGFNPEQCRERTKQTTLEGTKYPTVLVEMSGTYSPGAMMGPASTPKENFTMLAAEVRTPDRAWYFKLVGPQKTVDRWREPFVEYVKAAK